MHHLKLRFILAGIIVSTIGGILMIVKGFNYLLLGIVCVGPVAITFGLILKPDKKENTDSP
jgi:hypothetical protein